MKIAIGITTTPNRSHIFAETLKKWQEFCPPNALIWAHVDAGYKGIPTSKNVVLALCDYADHVFIVDDDIFPVTSGWWLPYTESSLNHACWNYDRKIIDASNQLYDVLETPNGCMLYFTKQAIEKVGGWDTDFMGWSYEHVNLSDRIFNNGLTPARYIDIANTKHIFKIMQCESSIPNSVKGASIKHNYALYKQNYYSKEFKPFK